MNGEELQQNKHANDLGVVFDRDLKFSQYFAESVKNGNRLYI